MYYDISYKGVCVNDLRWAPAKPIIKRAFFPPVFNNFNTLKAWL